jgi:hypothetical protein
MEIKHEYLDKRMSQKTYLVGGNEIPHEKEDAHNNMLRNRNYVGTRNLKQKS